MLYKVWQRFNFLLLLLVLTMVIRKCSQNVFIIFKRCSFFDDGADFNVSCSTWRQPCAPRLLRPGSAPGITYGGVCDASYLVFDTHTHTLVNTASGAVSPPFLRRVLVFGNSASVFSFAGLSAWCTLRPPRHRCFQFDLLSRLAW